MCFEESYLEPTRIGRIVHAMLFKRVYLNAASPFDVLKYSRLLYGL